MIKRILVGLGGTPLSAVATQRAVELAQLHGADLIVTGNSARSLWFRHLLGDTMLRTIQQTDRPLFLSQ